MKFAELSIYLDKLEKTSSRLEITKILSDLFKTADINEIDKIVYLSLGILAPNYDGVLLNLAERMMIRVLARAYGLSEDEVQSEYKKAGDIGDVAQKLNRNTDKKVMSVEEVYENLFGIAKDSGEGSQDSKIERMVGLLKNLDPLSARFVARIPIGRLRLGFSEKTIISALANGNTQFETDLEKAYNIRPDIGYISKLVKEGNIKEAKPEVGVPVVPMLAQRLNSASDMIQKMGEVAVEPKFDGLRIFIHYTKPNFVKVFTRNMNSIDISTFPELSDIGRYLKADKVILDTEAIGIDPKREMFLDFQKTIQRRRKHDVEKTAGDVPLQFQVFDVLLVDGLSLIHEPYTKRRSVLLKIIKSGGPLRVDESTITNNADVIRSLHQKYLKMGLEGVVVKRANGNYVSGRTGWNWVKMKEEEGKTGRLADTVDCVIMGATSGKGKRVGFGVGQFLAGVLDGDKFKTVTKVGTGLTDEQFKELNKRLKDLKTTDMPKEYEVHKDLAPDFWVVPEVVIELAADEITKSPKHTAGLALRFPRLIKFRDDKNAGAVTTLKELHDLFTLQNKNK